MFWRLLLLAGVLILAPGLAPTSALAQSDAEQTRAQLEQLEKDIKRITWEINTASKERNDLQEKLRAAETELGRLKRSIADTKSSIEAQEKQLAQLRAKQETLEKARDEQQERIAVELKTAWQMGSQSQLKMLLSQQKPETVARSMSYYRYFFTARNELLASYRITLEEIAALQQRIDATLQELQTKRQKLEKEQTALASTQLERQAALADLLASISTKAAQLKQKEANRKELGSLLQAIEVAIEKLELPNNYQPFQNAKGAMPWPLTGKRANRFGRPRNEGKMRWQGITIRAREGTPVTAIHHGRVVYADWFRGSGLLMIIDHGEGYMSLYAHNQSLLKDVGEWVTADTPISTVGNSGGQDRSALYFEIRHKGKPTDPAKWCKK